jgi:hypothetical protein
MNVEECDPEEIQELVEDIEPEAVLQKLETETNGEKDDKAVSHATSNASSRRANKTDGKHRRAN